MARRVALLLCVLLSASALRAQDSFFDKWEARTSATQAKQPAWSPPLITIFNGLIQVARTDFTRQISPSRATTWNYGTSKGVNLIPWANTEIDINLPPYLTHSAPTTIDGAGDMSFAVKYRVLTGNAEHGNYIISVCLPISIPTGSHKNGSTNASLSPTFEAGKGFGRFNLQSTIGATLPTGNTVKLGRPVVWNTSAQYHLGRYFWPAIESNATFFHGGPNDGKSQEFLTPELLIGKIPVRREKRTRLGLSIGAGEQIATSHFHAYNHALIFTSRFLF